jgi:hypothetical protein
MKCSHLLSSEGKGVPEENAYRCFRFVRPANEEGIGPER